MKTKIIAGLFTTLLLISMVNMVLTVRAQEELKYDDGTPNGSVQWGTVAYDNMFAVRFTAPYAAQILTLRFYMLGGPFEDLTIHVLDTNRNEMSGFTQFNQSVHIDWNAVDLSAYHLTVAANEDFYLALEWTVASSNRLGMDLDLPHDGRSWQHTTNRDPAWQLLVPSYGDADLMIRAIIEPIPADGVSLFSNILMILPLSVLASVLVVLRRRRT